MEIASELKKAFADETKAKEFYLRECMFPMIIKPKLQSLAIVEYFLNDYYDQETRDRVLIKVKHMLLNLKNKKSDKYIINKVLNDELGLSCHNIIHGEPDLNVINGIVKKYEYEWMCE